MSDIAKPHPPGKELAVPGTGGTSKPAGKELATNANGNLAHDYGKDLAQ
jgi:hypothetical protein